MESPGFQLVVLDSKKAPNMVFAGIDGHMFPVEKTRSSQVL